MLLLPKSTVKRLYDASTWTKKQIRNSRIVKLIFLPTYLLIIFIPLQIHSLDFIIGTIVFLLGYLFFLISVLNYNATPLGTPVTKGLYSISRNPQIVGLYIVFIGLKIGVRSVLTLMLFICGILLSHFRILAEEKQCLQQYGENYEEYMKKVPRYFLFF